MKETKKDSIHLAEAISVLLAMLVIMGIGIMYLQLSPLVPILTVIMLLIFWARLRGFTWDDVNDSLVVGIKNGIVPLFIFMLIGTLIGVWISSGVIPSLMVFGFKLISIKWFLPSVFLICAIIGTFVGSAFTVISTVGIALMGIGITMGINPAMVAGAVISGAVFGDKSSPLSASTNLTTAVVGVDLFDHIKNMMWSTIPAFIGSLILFSLIGNGHQSADLSKINQTVNVLNQNFSISWVALIPVVLLIICAWIKIPTVPTLFINVIVSIGLLFVHNPDFKIAKLANIIENGFVAQTKNQQVNQLLSRGGISSMMSTVALIIVALALGGLLMHLGVIETVMQSLTAKINQTGNLILAVILSAIGVNVFIGEQFLSIILPGNAYKQKFLETNLSPLTLSRALEDGGAVINYLVPWGVAAVFVAHTLNVPTLDYLPFVFFSLLSPVFSLISAFTGIGIKHKQKES